MVDNLSITPLDKTEPCPSQYLTLVHLYEQSRRHPFQYIEHNRDELSKKAQTRNNLTVKELPIPPLLPPSSKENPPNLVIKGTTKANLVDTITLSGVLFEHDKAVIQANYRMMLDSLAEKLGTQSFSKISIIGHTDNNGTESYNQNLSKRRAQSVANFLIQNIHDRKHM